MRNMSRYAAGKKLLFGTLLLLCTLFSNFTKAAGVTIITHGYEDDCSFPTWVVPWRRCHAYFHYRYPILRHKFYNLQTYTFRQRQQLLIFINPHQWQLTPSATESGEIVIELDWSSLSGDLLDSYASTYNVGWAVSQILMLTNAISRT